MFFMDCTEEELSVTHDITAGVAFPKGELSAMLCWHGEILTSIRCQVLVNVADDGDQVFGPSDIDRLIDEIDSRLVMENADEVHHVVERFLNALPSLYEKRLDAAELEVACQDASAVMS